MNLDMKNNIQSFNHYRKEYEKSITNPEKFWAEKAEKFIWEKKWKNVLSWDFSTPDVKWFEGGKLNITTNCLDRHLIRNPLQTAIRWVPNSPKEKIVTLSYQKLHSEVCKFSNVLKNHGAKKGDRICLYMPMVPELAIAVLACARIGAIHSVVFAGFSAKSLSDRINDAKCKALITADGGYRGNKITPLKEIADEAMTITPSIDFCIVLKRTESKIIMKENRDYYWQSEMKEISSNCIAEIMDSEDKLFILYTSGSTGKPKGIVHTTAGYMVYAQYSFENVFQYKAGDLYWCTADIGWITGHSYIIYGPLLAGATTVMFEGVPTYPDAGRFWEIVEKNKINIFYTAPTAIRSLEAYGNDFVRKYNLDSLKVLGTVGEPINEDAWNWYFNEIGNKKCPIVDTWWQTETGGHMITPLPFATELKPGSATQPFFGVEPQVLTESGEVLEGEASGVLVLARSWPGQMRTLYNNHERFMEAYFSTFPGKYFAGDGVKRDADGYYWITGRVDDVLNISGHRLGTAEIESALVLHTNVSEAAVVGMPHEIKGQGIYAYVSLMSGIEGNEELKKDLVALVRKEIGPIATVDKIQFAQGLPKTRSGKIMRRILRKIAEDDYEELGDTSTLAEPAVVDDLISNRVQ